MATELNASEYLLFENENLFEQNFSTFNKMRKSGQFCDVEIIVGGRSLPAHRLVLAAVIPYFKQLFTMANQTSAVIIKEVKPEIMEQFIDYSYTGKFEIKCELITDILKCAILLQIGKIRDASIKLLIQTITEDTVRKVMNIGYDLNLPDVIQAADRFISRNFVSMAANNILSNFDGNEIVDLLGRDDLEVSSEEEVYKIAIKWIKYKLNERKAFVPSVLSKIRLTLLSADFLLDVVSSEKLVQDSFTARSLVEKATFYLLLPNRKDLAQNFNTNPRMCHAPTDMSASEAESDWKDGQFCNSTEVSEESDESPEQVGESEEEQSTTAETIEISNVVETFSNSVDISIQTDRIVVESPGADRTYDAGNNSTMNYVRRRPANVDISIQTDRIVTENSERSLLIEESINSSSSFHDMSMQTDRIVKESIIEEDSSSFSSHEEECIELSQSLDLQESEDESTENLDFTESHAYGVEASYISGFSRLDINESENSTGTISFLYSDGEIPCQSDPENETYGSSNPLIHTL